MKSLTLFAVVSAFFASASAQAAVWAQCGGIGWTGSTTCTSGNVCTELNDYYFQCIPGTASSASTVAPPVTPPPATTTSVVSSPPTTPPPTTTSSGATPTGSQLRTDDDPVYHFYLQSNDGAVMLGPEASSGYFTISNTISLNNPDGSELYLNLDTSATTSYVPLSFDPTATTTDWALEGDTIITSDPRQLNFLVCATSDPNFYSVYLQNGNDQPAGATCSLQTIHLPCLC